MKILNAIAILLYIPNAWSETLHPELVLPAIESSISSVQEQIKHHKELKESLGSDQGIISLDPFGQSPSDEMPQQSAANFKFWEIADNDTFGLFIESLSFELDMADYRRSSEFDDLPIGYGVVRYVVRFEIHSRFSGWFALENVGPDEMEEVFSFYRRAGFPEEAHGLKKAQEAWYFAQNQNQEENAAAGKAYKTIQNPYSDADERWDAILDKLRESSWWVGRN